MSGALRPTTRYTPGRSLGAPAVLTVDGENPLISVLCARARSTQEKRQKCRTTGATDCVPALRTAQLVSSVAFYVTCNLQIRCLVLAKCFSTFFYYFQASSPTSAHATSSVRMPSSWARAA